MIPHRPWRAGLLLAVSLLSGCCTTADCLDRAGDWMLRQQVSALQDELREAKLPEILGALAKDPRAIDGRTLTLLQDFAELQVRPIVAGHDREVQLYESTFHKQVSTGLNEIRIVLTPDLSYSLSVEPISKTLRIHPIAFRAIFETASLVGQPEWSIYYRQLLDRGLVREPVYGSGTPGSSSSEFQYFAAVVRNLANPSFLSDIDRMDATAREAALEFSALFFPARAACLSGRFRRSLELSILHELGHVALSHAPTRKAALSKANELEADGFASFAYTISGRWRTGCADDAMSQVFGDRNNSKELMIPDFSESYFRTAFLVIHGKSELTSDTRDTHPTNAERTAFFRTINESIRRNLAAARQNCIFQKQEAAFRADGAARRILGPGGMRIDFTECL